MQACRGRSDGTLVLGVDGLVAFLVCRFALAVHVVRQGQTPIYLGIHELIPADVAVAFIVDAFHRASGIPHLHSATYLHLLTGAYEAFPDQFLSQPGAHEFDTTIV